MQSVAEVPLNGGLSLLEFAVVLYGRTVLFYSDFKSPINNKEIA